MNRLNYTADPAGLRMTQQRRVILEELRTCAEHPTADALYRRVRQRLPSISLGTVYRNLEVLSQAGLIVTLRLDGRQRRFDGVLKRHYHVRCVQCGGISDVPGGSFRGLDDAAGRASRFTILGHRLTFEGLCPDCKEGVEAANGHAGRPEE